MKIRSPEDESDQKGTAQGEEEELHGKNDSGEESSLMDLESRYVRVRKRTLVEIFAVLLLEKEKTLGIDQILQENLVLSAMNHHGVFKDHVLCDISANKAMQIDSQCYLILNGPDYGLEIRNAFHMAPSYDPIFAIKTKCGLWDRYNDAPDTFMCGWMETVNGFVVVKFAVYPDGLEAQLEVTMSDLELPGMPLDVYGTVTTSNSVVSHTEAKSCVFNHIRSDYCALPDLASSAKVEIPLPLSRRVTVIPRESTLIVDLKLFLRCASGDISIANESVSFDAGANSNTVEEHIIKCSYLKLKVKVTWVEALEYDREEKEEKRAVVDNGEVTEVVGTTNEKFDREGHQGTDTDHTYDDDCSSQSLKYRRLNNNDDISTRNVDYPTTEAMEIVGGEQGGAPPFMPSQVERFKENYLEVFSVKFLDIENLKLDEIYGLIMIHTSLPPHLLFRRVRGDPSKIDSQGFSILEGPRLCAWEVSDLACIVPFLFKYQEFDFSGKHGSCDLWRSTDDDNIDKLLCKILDTDLGRIKVNFAVYEDSVEAHLSVMLTDCSFSRARVHGTITASNSMLQDPAAVSFVFKKEKTEADHVVIEPGKDISLLLLRPVVALPLGSMFYVKFDIFTEDVLISDRFQVKVLLDGEGGQTFPSNGCGVKIHVKFTTKQDYVDFFH